MGVKVFSRNSVVYNSIIFVLLSPLFLHLIYSLHLGNSAVSIDGLIAFLEVRPWLLAFIGLTIFALFRVWRASPYIFAFFVIIVFALSFWPFILSFNKLLLFLSTIYLLISFYLFVILRLERDEAVYRPGYHRRMMGPKYHNDLPVEISRVNGAEKILGHLTNWDKGTLFFVTDFERPLRGKVRVNLEFNGRKFSALGVVATSYAGGYGVRIIEASPNEGNSSHHSDELGWNEYYDIIDSRGYRPILVN